MYFAIKHNNGAEEEKKNDSKLNRLLLQYFIERKLDALFIASIER